MRLHTLFFSNVFFSFITLSLAEAIQPSQRGSSEADPFHATSIPRIRRQEGSHTPKRLKRSYSDPSNTPGSDNDNDPYASPPPGPDPFASGGSQNFSNEPSYPAPSPGNTSSDPSYPAPFPGNSSDGPYGSGSGPDGGISGPGSSNMSQNWLTMLESILNTTIDALPGLEDFSEQIKELLNNQLDDTLGDGQDTGTSPVLGPGDSLNATQASNMSVDGQVNQTDTVGEEVDMKGRFANGSSCDTEGYITLTATSLTTLSGFFSMIKDLQASVSNDGREATVTLVKKVQAAISLCMLTVIKITATPDVTECHVPPSETTYSSQIEANMTMIAQMVESLKSDMHGTSYNASADVGVDANLNATTNATTTIGSPDYPGSQPGGGTTVGGTPGRSKCRPTQPPNPYGNGYGNPWDSGGPGSGETGPGETSDPFGAGSQNDPYGSSGNSSGPTGSPYGFTGSPYGSTGNPYGSTTNPYGSSGNPYGSTENPYGSTEVPYGTTATTEPIYSGNGPPYGPTPDPYGSSGNSYGSTGNSYGSTGTSYGPTPDPYGDTASTYGSNKDPYASIGTADINGGNSYGDLNYGNLLRRRQPSSSYDPDENHEKNGDSGSSDGNGSGGKGSGGSGSGGNGSGGSGNGGNGSGGNEAGGDGTGGIGSGGSGSGSNGSGGNGNSGNDANGISGVPHDFTDPIQYATGPAMYRDSQGNIIDNNQNPSFYDPDGNPQNLTELGYPLQQGHNGSGSSGDEDCEPDSGMSEIDSMLQNLEASFQAANQTAVGVCQSKPSQGPTGVHLGATSESPINVNVAAHITVNSRVINNFILNKNGGTASQGDSGLGGYPGNNGDNGSSGGTFTQNNNFNFSSSSQTSSQVVNNYYLNGERNGSITSPNGSGNGDLYPTGGQGSTYPTGGQGDNNPTGKQGNNYPTGGQGDSYPTGGQGSNYPTGGQGSNYPSGGGPNGNMTQGNGKYPLGGDQSGGDNNTPMPGIGSGSPDGYPTSGDNSGSPNNSSSGGGPDSSNGYPSSENGPDSMGNPSPSNGYPTNGDGSESSGNSPGGGSSPSEGYPSGGPSITSPEGTGNSQACVCKPDSQTHLRIRSLEQQLASVHRIIKKRGLSEL